MKSKKSTKNESTDAARVAEILTRVQDIDKKHLYLQSFIRGMAAGAGTVIGATIIIAIVLWLLSLFDTIPLIGPFFDQARTTIEQR